MGHEPFDTFEKGDKKLISDRGPWEGRWQGQKVLWT